MSRPVGKHMVAHATDRHDVWVIRTKKGHALGRTAWHRPWRTHELIPEVFAVFTHECLTALGEFLRDLDRERREESNG